MIEMPNFLPTPTKLLLPLLALGVLAPLAHAKIK